MSMDAKEMAIEIAQRFIEMEDEIRSLRTVLHRYWTHEIPAETFVQKGIQQLQAREKEEQGFQRLQAAFDAAAGDAAIVRILYQEALGRAKV